MTARKKRNRKPSTPEQQARKDFRKANDTHVAVFDLKIEHNDLRALVNQAKSVQYIKRRLRAYYRKAFEQYKRTRKYRETIKAYHKTSNKSEKKDLGKILNHLQEQAGITEQAGKDLASYWAKRCGLQAVFGLTAFEDVWSGVEKILYNGAKKLDGGSDALSLRAKQANRGIIIKTTCRGKLAFEMNGMRFYPDIAPDDLFLRDEQEAICRYLLNESVEKDAVKHFLLTGEITSTYRPKYVTLVLKHVRGKWIAQAHVSVEGEALSKKRSDGSPRFVRTVEGEIGMDIGTQSYACVGANICEMGNLAERNGRSMKNEARLRRLQRHADRCLRAANPQNYAENGSIRKGKKKWVRSKEYERTQYKIRAYHRKCALNRKYAIREDANRLREHGSVIVSEQQSIRGWQTGLFGKSIQSRCPGAFRAELKRKFLDYIEVDLMYRASQYDHERDSYEKKKLSQRKHYHGDGRASPRDGYSGFLLWCHDDEYASPDRGLCVARFDDYYERMTSFVEDCKSNGVSVVNGGF